MYNHIKEFTLLKAARNYWNLYLYLPLLPTIWAGYNNLAIYCIYGKQENQEPHPTRSISESLRTMCVCATCNCSYSVITCLVLLVLVFRGLLAQGQGQDVRHGGRGAGVKEGEAGVQVPDRAHSIYIYCTTYIRFNNKNRR